MELKRLGLLVASCGLLAAVALPAQAVVINDEYWGANANAECLGCGTYGISSAEVTRTGTDSNLLTITITTVFAGEGGQYWADNRTNTTAGMSKGIGYGDLFLSSDWDPHIDDPTSIAPSYKQDEASNGTVWTYGLAFDENLDRWEQTGTGDATLYSLGSGNNLTDALLSDAFMNTPVAVSNSQFRNGQEVAVNTDSDGVEDTGKTGSWTVTDSTVQFTIDLTGTGLEDTKVAFHWGMTCANDVIEEEIGPPSAIPVPAAVWLFGSGLLGLVSIARRRKRS